MKISLKVLEKIYLGFNRKDLIHPDPLEFLSRYGKPEDIEIIGLLASSLAYGRVSQILLSVNKIIDYLGPGPKGFLLKKHNEKFSDMPPFKHRFTTREEMAGFLAGITRIIRDYGSLHQCFLSGYDDHHADIIPALIHFVDTLKQASGLASSSLLPDPGKGSACKRLMLYLRWMVRKDNLDTGIWTGISPDKLIIPLDTHMMHFATCYGFTARKNADLVTAREITAAFKLLNPLDPVKYDFALTRFGIKNNLCWDDLDRAVESGEIILPASGS